MRELTTLFSTVLDLSVTVLPVLALVLLARALLLRRGLHRVAYGLWAVVGLRLALPVSLPSPLSLFNLESAQLVRSAGGGVAPTLGALTPGGAPLAPLVMPAGGLGDTALLSQPRFTLLGLLAVIWLMGVLLLLLYALVSYIRLKRRLDCAILLGENVWESEAVDTPFVLALLRPRIYLPLGLSEEERACVLLHEQTHIRRGDVWVKPLAYVFLAVYWFHPGVWLAWFCLGRDMELCCDEAVLRRLGPGVKTAYSGTLLSLATARRFPAPSPLAFGEHDASARIKHVLRWKKAAPAVSFLAAALCVLLAAVCVTDGISGGSWVIRRLGGSTATEQPGGVVMGFDLHVSEQVGAVSFYQESYRNGQREEDRRFLSVGVGGAAEETELELTAVPDTTTGEVDWIVRHGGAVAYNERGKELFQGQWMPPTGERRYFGQSMSVLGDGDFRKRQDLEADSDLVLMAWFFMEEGDEKPFTCASITESGAAEAAKVFDRVVLLRMKLTPQDWSGGWVRARGEVPSATDLTEGSGRFELDCTEEVKSFVLYEESYFRGARQVMPMVMENFDGGASQRQLVLEATGQANLQSGQIGWKIRSEGTGSSFASSGREGGNTPGTGTELEIWDTEGKRYPLGANEDLVLMAWRISGRDDHSFGTGPTIDTYGNGAELADGEKLILLRLRLSSSDMDTTCRQLEGRDDGFA